jgi:hypothetical protein
MLKTVIPLLALTAFSSLASTTLTGLNGIDFGQPSESVLALVKDKPGYEENRADEDTLRLVQWKTTVNGDDYTTRTFFKNDIVNGFNLTRSAEYATSSSCDNQHINIAKTINAKYNVKRLGFANLQFGVGYRTSLWKFNDTQHIELNTNFNEILDTCHVMVWYRNEPISDYTTERYNEWLTSQHFKEDTF